MIFARPEVARGLAAAISASTLLAACALTTSFAGLSVGPVDGGAGGSSASDGSAAMDGSVPDSRAPEASTADGQSFFRCADHATAVFCADFDGEPFDLGFEKVPPANGAGSGASTSFFSSPPRSLLATLPARGSSPMLPVAGVLRRLPGTRSLLLSFALRIEESTDQDGIDVASISYRPASGFYGVFLRYRRNPAPNFLLFEFATSPSLTRFVDLPGRPKLGAFAHVEMTLDVASTSSAISVAVDGSPLVVTSPLSAHQYVTSTPIVQLGIVGSNDTGGPIEIRFDDVLVEAL